MFCLEYERLRRQYLEVRNRHSELLNEATALFNRTQPRAVDPGKGPGGSSGYSGSDAFDSYLIDMEKHRLDERIAEAEKLVRSWDRLLDQRRGELRRSRDLWDRVYVGRYLDRLPTQQLAMRCGITRVHVYRILKKIENSAGQ